MNSNKRNIKPRTKVIYTSYSQLHNFSKNNKSTNNRDNINLLSNNNNNKIDPFTIPYQSYFYEDLQLFNNFKEISINNCKEIYIDFIKKFIIILQQLFTQNGLQSENIDIKIK